MTARERTENLAFAVLFVLALGCIAVFGTAQLVPLPGWLLLVALGAVLVVAVAEAWLVARRARAEGVGWVTVVGRSTREGLRTLWTLVMG